MRLKKLIKMSLIYKIASESTASYKSNFPGSYASLLRNDKDTENSFYVENSFRYEELTRN